MNTTSTLASQRGAILTKPSVTASGSMPGMTMATAFVKFMSIRLKGFGRCSAPGCARIEVSRRRICLSISAFLSLFIMRRHAARPSWDLSLNSSSLSSLKPRLSQLFFARAVTLSAAGKLVAAADDGGLVRVWGLDGEPKVPQDLRGHEGPVYAASFSPDGKFILTGGADKTARLWQVDRLKAIANPDQSQNWTTRLKELTELARKTAGRNLTSEEWSQFFPDAEYRPTFPILPTPTTEK